MGFILSTLALIFFTLVYILDGVWSSIANTWKRKWFKTVSERKYNKAFKVDVFGNWLFKDFWNAVLSKGGYEFGKFGETISSVLGKKKLEGSLSLIGLSLATTIDFVDFTKWKAGGHCVAYIMSEEDISKFLTRV